MPPKPFWWPVAPNFNITFNPGPAGKDRNRPCNCGSGIKSKRCTACRVITPKFQNYTHEDYHAKVKLLVDQQPFPAWMHGYKIDSYWRTGVITPAEAADFLVQFTKCQIEAGLARPDGKPNHVAEREEYEATRLERDRLAEDDQMDGLTMTYTLTAPRKHGMRRARHMMPMMAALMLSAGSLGKFDSIR